MEKLQRIATTVFSVALAIVAIRIIIALFTGGESATP